MERLYQQYKERAAFLLVYIREAHPDSILYTAEGDGGALEQFAQTETLEQRAQHAQVCTASLKLSMPTVVDREDNAVNRQYAGWPDRFVIVGKDGKLAFIGKQGPSGFKPEEVEKWLEENTSPPNQPPLDAP